MNSVQLLATFAQSRSLSGVILSTLVGAQSEYAILGRADDNSGNDVINGLQSLVLHPERAAWCSAPQHYLVTQDSSNGGLEALLMCKQGDRLANSESVRLLSPSETVLARKKQYKTPYEMPSHLVAMNVSIDATDSDDHEEILHHLEIRTADPLIPYPNKEGFLVSKLEDTMFLQEYVVRLPDDYRDLLRQEENTTLYICITAKGQDIVLSAIRAREPSSIPDIEWLTLPEVRGTYSADLIDTFQTSVCVTAAVRQGMDASLLWSEP